MLSTNVLCMKKRKKRTYSFSTKKDECRQLTKSSNRCDSKTVTTMLQVTEDTPPDMLAGAMDITVQLPSGKTVQMAIERSTPMLDLLVQITTIHHLHISSYSLQVFEMSPSSAGTTKILPYKPNTPIGTLDTQYIKVVPKFKTIPAPKPVAPGHQPFESTFRLQVHLPRNQLYVTRVSRNVLLEDIMKKVCEEKNLDPLKYEFKHPENLDEVLDSKLTLNDYQITEIYVVAKGKINQTFSTSDIMALKKEEERKQLLNKTGGGVFNLIFRRGKSSMGSGSLSSETRSISPTHSDDSRSVTPPNLPTPAPPKIEPLEERPKPPQRKRRPAPKPPGKSDIPPPQSNESRLLPKTNEDTQNKIDNGLPIYHSRNSSDSSGYHEASVLSDNCNTSLPRRPQSAYVSNDDSLDKFSKTQSGSNLMQMAIHSKSASGLTLTGRRKKPAPPPPPVLKTANSVAEIVGASSPVVASQSSNNPEQKPEESQWGYINSTNPTPAPRRNKNAPPPVPKPRLLNRTSIIEDLELSNSKGEEEFDNCSNSDFGSKYEDDGSSILGESSLDTDRRVENSSVLEDSSLDIDRRIEDSSVLEDSSSDIDRRVENSSVLEDSSLDTDRRIEDSSVLEDSSLDTDRTIEDSSVLEDSSLDTDRKIENSSGLEDLTLDENSNIVISESEQKIRPPEIVAMIPKVKKSGGKKKHDTFTKKQRFSIGSSLLSYNFDSDTTSLSSSQSKYSSFDDEIDIVDETSFTNSNVNKTSSSQTKIFNQLYGMHDFEQDYRPKKNFSGNSLRSIDSFVNGNMKKWNNTENLDNISFNSGVTNNNKWVVGDSSDTESIASTNVTNSLQSVDNITPNNSSKCQNNPILEQQPVLTNTVEKPETLPDLQIDTIKPEENVVTSPKEILPPTEVNELDWQYQLPSPPRAFRDSSPPEFVTEDTNESRQPTITEDSVVTSPELFEKLKAIEDHCSDLQSVASEDTNDKVILNQLSLENLEKRRSLVYNRELATSLKMNNLETTEKKSDGFTTSLTTFETTYNEVRKTNVVKSKTSTLPNFKITTYDQPKQKIKVFEDDTVRSNTDANKLTKTYLGQSMENISHRKNSLDSESREYDFYKPQSTVVQKPIGFSVHRSESFAHDQHWSPPKPVSRSKSHLTLNNKYSELKLKQNEESLSRSNSLFDVSGLQSLEVIKLIQNKLNTPTSSIENVNQINHQPAKEVKPAPKTYQYSGPPAINMSTWSERPKIPVSVKQDSDYKLGNNNLSSKILVRTTNDSITSSNSVEVKQNNQSNTNSYSIKINNNYYESPESKAQISTESAGNVVIKIGGGNTPKTIDTQRLVNHTTPMGYRKPFSDIKQQRPHSIAIDSNVDISRVPVVRSVELKKPLKDVQGTNTSITQIYQGNFKTKPETTVNNFPSIYKSSENLNSYFNKNNRESANNYKSIPTVRGFKSIDLTNNRPTWNYNNNYNTLPVKPNPTKEIFTTNKHIPFSQSNLRRTESNRILPEDDAVKTKTDVNRLNQKNSFRSGPIAPPPPPPPVTVKKTPRQLEPVVDPRDQLLAAIRNFGGKKGLKSVKT